MRALANCAEVPFINAKFDELGHNCLCTLLAQRVVDLVGTLVLNSNWKCNDFQSQSYNSFGTLQTSVV